MSFTSNKLSRKCQTMIDDQIHITKHWGEKIEWFWWQFCCCFILYLSSIQFTFVINDVLYNRTVAREQIRNWIGNLLSYLSACLMLSSIILQMCNFIIMTFSILIWLDVDWPYLRNSLIQNISKNYFINSNNRINCMKLDTCIQLSQMKQTKNLGT